MISPRRLFLKQPFASEIANALVTDKWQHALSSAFAEVMVNNAFTADQQNAIARFIQELLTIGVPITAPMPDPQVQLDYDLLRKPPMPEKPAAKSGSN